MVPYSLSLSDLLLVDGFIEVFALNSQEGIKKILHQNGMQTNKVTTVEVEHRNLQGNVVTCLRYQGYEREDPQWLRSGACSKEVFLQTNAMKGMGAELSRMSREGVSIEKNYESDDYDIEEE